MKQLLGIALLAAALAVAPGIAGATSSTTHQTKKHSGKKHAASGTTKPAPDAMKPAN